MSSIQFTSLKFEEGGGGGGGGVNPGSIEQAAT